MKSKEAKCAGMREDRDLLSLVFAKYVPELGSAASKKVAIAFAVRDHMMDATIDERVVITRMMFS